MKSPQIKEIDGKSYIFDIIRKKYLLLTPEEKVRQTFINFLIFDKKYSKSLIQTERGLKYHALQKRTDILVFGKNAQPYILVECKAENVPLTHAVLEQASRYNLTVKAPFLCITNGLKTYCFKVDFDKNTTTQISEFPLPQV